MLLDVWEKRQSLEENVTTLLYKRLMPQRLVFSHNNFVASEKVRIQYRIWQLFSSSQLQYIHMHDTFGPPPPQRELRGAIVWGPAHLKL